MTNHEGRVNPPGPALRQQAWIVVLVAVLVSAAAAAYGLSRSTAYHSAATILVTPTVGNAYSPETASSAQQLITAMTTEASLVRSATVLGRADDELGTTTTLEPVDVVATVPDDTQTIKIVVSGPTAVLARDRADAVAAAFLEFRSQRAQDRVEAQRRQLDRALSQARVDLRTAAQLTGASRQQSIDLAAAEISAIRSQLLTLDQISDNAGSVVNPATLPAGDSGPPWFLLALVGLVAGATGGAGVALLTERVRDRIRTSMTAVAGVPVLASLGPAARRTVQSPEGEIEQDEITAYAVRQARTIILNTFSPPAVLAVSDVSGDVGVDAVTVAVATSLAAADLAVLVIATESGALADQPTETTTLAQALADTADGSVWPRHHTPTLVTSGDLAPDQLAGVWFAELIKDLRSRWDLVLLVSPIDHGAGGGDVVGASDGLLLVAAVDSSTIWQVETAANEAARIGTPTVGLLLAPTISRATSVPND